MKGRALRRAIAVLVAASSALSPAAAAAEDSPPVLVDFDDLDPAPDLFIDATALRDRYAGLGVLFDAPASDGAAILDAASGFGVSGYSGSNFLAFSAAEDIVLADGGFPRLPETVWFDPPIERVEMLAGDADGHRISLAAFDALGGPTGTAFVDAGAELQSVGVEQRGTVRLEITTDGESGVIDDLAFVPVAPCLHDPCYVGAALDSYCSICVTRVCAGDASCCGEDWTLACTEAVAGTCERVCPVLCGDANVDGRVTASDAQLALRTAVGAADCVAGRCDFTGDGDVLASDAQAILRAAVGQTVLPQCPAA